MSEKKPQKLKRDIKVAYYDFRCPITGEWVKKGSNYYDLEGFKMSINAVID